MLVEKGRDNSLCIIAMIISMAFFSIEDAIIKILAQSMPISQVLISIGIVGTLALFCIAKVLRSPLKIFKKNKVTLFLRMICELISSICFVITIVYVSLSISSAILQATPILVALGGILFLNQKVKLYQWVFIAIGFLGVFFILRPDSNEFNSLSLIAILGVFFLALRDVITHKISDTIPAVSISFWGFFSLTVGGIFCIPFFGSFIPFNYQNSALILFSAFIGPSAYLALVFATRSGDVATISPFRYTRLPFALTISFFLFDERLDSSMLIGCFFVVFSGFCILLFNTKKAY